MLHYFDIINSIIILFLSHLALLLWILSFYFPFFLTFLKSFFDVDHFFKNKFIYLFLAALGLCCCVQAFSS